MAAGTPAGSSGGGARATPHALRTGRRHVISRMGERMVRSQAGALLGAAVAVLLAVPLFEAAPAAAAPVPAGSALLSLPAALTDGSTLAERKRKIDAELATASATYEAAGAKVQAAAAAYTLATASLPDAQAALATANGTMIAAKVALDRAQANADTARQAAAAAGVVESAAQVQVTTTRAVITHMAAVAYEGAGLLDLNAMMNPGSPTDMLDRMTMLDQLATTRHRELTGYQAAQMHAIDATNKAKQAQIVANAAANAADAALATSQDAQAKAAANLKDVNDLVAAKQAALKVAQANKAATLAAYQALQKESAAVAKQLAAQAAADKSSGGTVITTSRGLFIMPVHGPITSPFGMRFDPFYKRWQLHAGVDIGAAGGTPIKAAAAGRVIRAGWDGGYGNYTCIDHGLYQGKGLATCYAHQSKILVQVGQTVRQGQTIGLVGETGAATGYHLHFEVRINGTPVQPVTWLPKCWC